MARDRNDVKRAAEAWALAGERGLAGHQGQWGRSGVLGSLDQARGTAPRPKGTALIRWFREGRGGDGRGADAEDAAGQPGVQQHGHQDRGQTGPVEGDLEDDIYGADDDTTGARGEGGNTGDGDTTAGTANENAFGQQQTAEGGDNHRQGGYAPPAQ